MAASDKPFLLSIVIPVFNESEGLAHFHAALDRELKGHGWRQQIIYVDDGSNDETPAILKKIAAGDERVKLLSLSRNFGKEQATTAGLHAAVGDAVIIIDGDGQHPVELIPKFVQRWQKGAHVVIGVRTANQKEGFIKRAGSRLFYSSLRVFGVPNIVPGSTDFRLIDKQVLSEFKKLTERNRVTRALIDWLGYERDYIDFVANPRRHGTATYSFKKLVRLALNGFVSLSFMPLYLSGYMGVFITFLSFIASIFAIVEKYLLGDPLGWNITGTAILGIMILFLVGILLIGQGLLAIYVARIYTEVQNRPLYIIKD
jgi:dolichol-phosphate mannosyltransferase